MTSHSDKTARFHILTNIVDWGIKQLVIFCRTLIKYFHHLIMPLWRHRDYKHNKLHVSVIFVHNMICTMFHSIIQQMSFKYFVFPNIHLVPFFMLLSWYWSNIKNTWAIWTKEEIIFKKASAKSFTVPEVGQHIVHKSAHTSIISLSGLGEDLLETVSWRSFLSSLFVLQHLGSPSSKNKDGG